MTKIKIENVKKVSSMPLVDEEPVKEYKKQTKKQIAKQKADAKKKLEALKEKQSVHFKQPRSIVDGIDEGRVGRKSENENIITISEQFYVIKNLLKDSLFFRDYDVIDMVFAVVLSQVLTHDLPVFLIIVGAPAGGKTELVRPFGSRDGEHVELIESAGGHSLASRSTRHSIAEDLDKKIVIDKDFTHILGGQANSIDAFVSDLRSMYDGYIMVTSGKFSEKKRVDTHFTFIACVTPDAIEDAAKFKNGMGGRMIHIFIPKLRTVEDKLKYREKIKEKGLDINYGIDQQDHIEVEDQTEIFLKLIFAYGKYIESYLEKEAVEWLMKRRKKEIEYGEYVKGEIDDELQDYINLMSDFVANLRVNIRMDGRKVSSVGTSEELGRLAHQFKKTTKCLRILRGRDEYELADKLTITKSAFDTIPRNISTLLIPFIRQLPKTDSIGNNVIEEFMRLEYKTSRQTVDQRLEILYVNAVLDRETYDERKTKGSNKTDDENTKKSKLFWKFNERFLSEYRPVLDILNKIAIE